MKLEPWVKKLLLILVVAFALFYLFTNPEGAAAAVRRFFSLFGALAQFFTALAKP